MRLRLALLTTLLLVVATPADAQTITATVTPNDVEADPEDSPGGALGRRTWLATFAVTVESDVPCDRLGADIRERRLFNGRRVGDAPGLGWLGPAGTQTTHSWKTAGFAGETVRLDVVGECLLEGVWSRSPATVVRQAIPPHSCRQGPLEVRSVTGRVTSEDTYARRRRFLRLRRGDLLWQGSVRFGPEAALVYGAPQCNGYRVSVSGSLGIDVGTYAKGGRGWPTTVSTGTRILVRGDEHVGAVETLTASARLRTAGLLDVRSRATARGLTLAEATAASPTRVRVIRGAARVTQGLYLPEQLDRWWTLVVREGFETDVRCSATWVCAARRPWRFR
jgi:hypothetical protein